jgi:transcriptional regulator with XRE-family HTH domain
MIVNVVSRGRTKISIARLLRGTRRATGLTQRALAARAQITQPALAAIESSEHDTRGATLERLIAAAGYGLFVLPTHARAAADWADEIYQELRSSRKSDAVAFRAIIGLSDDLADADPAVRVALSVAPAPSCGDVRYDAAIAAVVEYHLQRDQLPIPSWVNETTRVLVSPWEVTIGVKEDEVPPAFRRHGVLLAESELASV